MSHNYLVELAGKIAAKAEADRQERVTEAKRNTEALEPAARKMADELNGLFRPYWIVIAERVHRLEFRIQNGTQVIPYVVKLEAKPTDEPIAPTPLSKGLSLYVVWHTDRLRGYACSGTYMYSAFCTPEEAVAWMAEHLLGRWKFESITDLELD